MEEAKKTTKRTKKTVEETTKKTTKKAVKETVLQEEVQANNENGVAIKDFQEFDVSPYVGVEKKAGMTMDTFRAYLKEQKVFPYKFTFVNGRGTLYGYEDDNIMVRMSSKEIDGFTKKITRENKAEIISQPYNVVVRNIDEKENMVFVSANLANEKPRQELLKYIEEGIEKKVYVKIPAKVVSITGMDMATRRPNASILMVNIGGLGITGMIRLKEWSTCFTKSFDPIVKVGDVIEVVVIGREDRRFGTVYECSRRLTIDFDPWKGINEKVPVGTGVRVLCTDKTEKNFFGIVHGLPEINVYCEYPDNEDIYISVGEEYAGYVSKVDETTKLLRVRIDKAL